MSFVTFRSLSIYVDTRVRFLSILIMNLRDHPMMIRKSGYPSWPPVWTTTHADRDNKPIGEVGTLEEVMMQHDRQQGFYVYRVRRLPIHGFHDL